MDPCLDLSWAVSAAAGTDTNVYGMLQPYLTPDGGGAIEWGAPEDLYPSQEHFVAAAATIYAQGCEGKPQRPRVMSSRRLKR